jgi:hypothetical protein
MDPDEALKNAREAAAHYHAGQPQFGTREYADVLGEIIDAFEALDERLSKGGFLPAAWSRDRDPVIETLTQLAKEKR